jgi:hypothetical protein
VFPAAATRATTCELWDRVKIVYDHVPKSECPHSVDPSLRNDDAYVPRECVFIEVLHEAVCKHGSHLIH